MGESSAQQTVDYKENPILSHEEQFARIKEMCQPFYLTDEQLLNIKESLLSEINKGLKVASNQQSSTKCWPTFVQEHPCGCEHGMFLVLEIRDHNFHISFIHLKGAHNYHHEKETHEIPKDLCTGYVEDFFDYLVKKLKKFLKQYKLDREQLSLALCFSFPLRHTSLRSAIVENIGKNLDIQNLVGQEVVKLLQGAIDRGKDLRVHVETVLSNCTAILLANSWEGHSCNIGINIGHGFNAVYVERVSEIETCSEQISMPNMIINTEWGEFGANGHLEDIRTVYDRQVDEVTRNKGQQKFEKLTSALYLGELARQIFSQCVSEKVLFGGYISNYLQSPFSFTSRHISDMLAEEDTNTFNHMRLQFDKLGISKPGETECSKVHYILHSITQRSAHLVACGINSLSEKSVDNHVVVGLGGSFYLNCHIYQSLLEEKLKKLLNKKRTFELKSLENGVAIGSALSAAIIKSREFVYYSEEMTNLDKVR